MRMTGRIAIVGASALLAAGAVALGGGPAMAATAQTPEHHPAAGVPRDTEHSSDRDRAARQPTDAWIADQLATFCPWSQHRLAVFDPWVKDQLATFEKTGR
ncbi:hypothetical protein ACZ91_65210 [Streptomyces regensis]|nr:hypothetical protein [Streptomyces antibioticus]KMS71082.1 hypothetical protein ACZ91_65210 [Streptomyces regensis]KOG61431.1 hypothetical protein ADK77_32025 [Streptomyces antibioticus]